MNSNQDVPVQRTFGNGFVVILLAAGLTLGSCSSGGHIAITEGDDFSPIAVSVSEIVVDARPDRLQNNQSVMGSLISVPVYVNVFNLTHDEIEISGVSVSMAPGSGDTGVISGFAKESRRVKLASGQDEDFRIMANGTTRATMVREVVLRVIVYLGSGQGIAYNFAVPVRTLDGR